jgi:hypothetical protein
MVPICGIRYGIGRGYVNIINATSDSVVCINYKAITIIIRVFLADNVVG